MCYSTYILLIVILIYLNYGAADFGTKNADNYGPYYVEWEHFDGCRGPKTANLTIYTTKLYKTDDDLFHGTLNMSFLEQAKIEDIKMTVYSLKDNGKTLLWNYIVNKPCQHYVIAALVESHLGVKNCLVKKGNFYMEFDLSTLMMKYIGNSFFYGEYLFKVLAVSKKGNIMCVLFDPKFKKKKAKNSN